MKRVGSILLALVLVLGVVFTTASVATADSVLYGDVNGDGKINNKDLGRLQQYINGWEVEVNLAACDVNDDGRVNNKDLGRLQQYINSWEVTLGPVAPEVPAAILPEVGYDIDGRGRILVDAISQDGYTVTVTLHNYSPKWMTEETSRVLYTCTDAEGNVLTIEGDTYFGSLYFGMLEVGEIDTFTITLPEGTAKLEFGDYYINYWSQWA